ncbi:hypothetical protein BGW38_008237, partial [Lunasporangiospora selenospora]
MHYLVEMRREPMADFEAFSAYMSEIPVVAGAISKIWATIKDFFDGQHIEDYEKLEGLMDINGMVEAFKEAPYIKDEENESGKQESPAHPRSNMATASSSALVNSVAARMKQRRITSSVRNPLHSSNNPSNSSRSSSLTAGAIGRMQYSFQNHSSAFKCTPWTIPSGADTDATIAGR